MMPPPVASSARRPTYATGSSTPAWRAATSGTGATKPRTSAAVRVRVAASSEAADAASSPTHRPTVVS